MKTYNINEMFYSIQGEGIRAGTANMFVRFAKCNMRCAMAPGPKSPGGFDCDTEFESGRMMTAAEIHAMALELIGGDSTDGGGTPDSAWMVLTGGEPGLQVDREFVDLMHGWGWKLAIETNGSIELPDGIDWVTVSPKVPEHAVGQRTADEVKYVMTHDQPIPETTVQADHYLLSPVSYGTVISHRALDWCICLVKENPRWRLSVQQHKAWNVR